jgi:tyrosyl-tRNA synthetase
MTEYKSDLLRVLRDRGYVHQISDPAGLDEAAATGAVATYVGYDCTADSLHIGHLVSIMMLRRLQEAGHKPIVLMGGGTSRVGDPSFRDQQRPLLSDATIEANKAAIKRSFANFLRFGDGPADAVMADNAEWLDELRYIPFLRDVGRHFSVNRMLTMDSVKSRLEREQAFSFLEFNYMLLQAYDFLELARSHKCRIQLGGSDPIQMWLNIPLMYFEPPQVRPTNRPNWRKSSGDTSAHPTV